MRVVLLCVLAFLVSGALGRPRTLSGTNELVQCGEGDDQPECKERTGKAEVAGGSEAAQTIQDLLSSFLPASYVNSQNASSSSSSSGLSSSQLSPLVKEFKLKAKDTKEQMKSVRTRMDHTQCEIDNITQSFLPQLQRCAVLNTVKTATLRDAMAAALVQSQTFSRELPRTSFMEDQRLISGVVTGLTTLQHKLQAAQREEEGGEVSFLQVNTPSTTLRTALTQADPAFIQTGSGSSDESVLGQAVELTAEAIELARQMGEVQRNNAAMEREQWGENIESMQDVIDSLSQSIRYHNTAAFACLSAATRMRLYLKDITAQQYRSLAWYNQMKDSLTTHAKHTTHAIGDYEEIRLLGHKLLHLLQNGENPYKPPLSDGCDGFGGQLDVCGVCGGDNSTCTSCDGIANGPSKLDVCGECGQGDGHTCTYFCDLVPNSGKIEDLCGVCNGRDNSCVGCDSLPHSSLQFDTCGVCGGDGRSCAREKHCENASCPSSISCPRGMVVTSEGFAGCCFNRKLDCVNATLV